MSAIARPPRRRRLLAPTLIASLALLGAAPPSAGATVPDACGLITEHDLAKALGLAHAIKHTTLDTQPGNSAGVLRQTCRVFAWRGHKPTNAKQKRAALLDGTLAQLTIRTWVPDEGPNAPLWRARFDSTLKKQRETASALFLKKLHGTRFLPPRFGADYSVAFDATTGGLARAQGLWWNRNDKTLLSMEVLEARGEPAGGGLRKVASRIVPGFSA
jgi:hypothetical protein